MAILREVCHIDVNLGKLAAWSKTVTAAPAGLERFGGGIWKSDVMPDRQGLKVLGTPIGTPQFINRFCAEQIEEKAQLLNSIPKLPSLQAAWLLFYFCAVPRINHLLRTLPPDITRAAALHHDRKILETFVAISESQVRANG